MKIASYVIFAVNTVAVISVLLAALKYRLSFRNSEETGTEEMSKKVIRRPKSDGKALMGLIFMYILFAVVIFRPIGNDDTRRAALWIPLFVVFIVPTWVLGLKAFNWKIEIFADHFIYTDFIGKKKRYGYDEIQIIRSDIFEKVIKDGKRMLTIDYVRLDFEGLKRVVSRYKRKQQKEEERLAKIQARLEREKEKEKDVITYEESVKNEQLVRGKPHRPARAVHERGVRNDDQSTAYLP